MKKLMRLTLILKRTKLVEWFINHTLRLILYCSVFVIGIGLVSISFSLKENWMSVTSGVGTGLLTSLVVSIAINTENDNRMKRKLLEDKRFILNDIVYGCTDVYIDVIYRINEYIMFSNLPLKGIYALNNDFKLYNEFETYLKQLDRTRLAQEANKNLELLFNIGNYRIDLLVAELKRLPKQEYYLKGLLSKDEYDGLTSNIANDSYLGYAEHIDEFWDNGIIDYEKCIIFMRMTVYICSKVISAIEYCKEDVARKERRIKDNLGQRYFDEVYSQSDDYIEQQLEAAQARDEYYSEHPEEYEKLMRLAEEWENETPEDGIIRELYRCLCGFSSYNLESLLKKVDSESIRILKFIMSKDVQKSINKSIKKRIAIFKKFGTKRKILNKIHELEEQTNGQA